MTTWNEGDTVTFNNQSEPRYKGSYTVLKTKDVPVDLIKYDLITTEGGVGHHQWIIIKWDDGKEHTFSGKWFEPT